MTTTTLVEENKKIARRFLELVSEGGLEELCEMVSPSWTMYGGLPGLPSGPEGIRVLFEHLGNIVQVWEINDVVAEGNTVVVRATNTCVQESFFGIPSYGKAQLFTAIFMHTIENGKITATWRNADDLGRVLQLGARLQASNSN